MIKRASSDLPPPRPDASPFSRPIDVHAVPEGGLDVAIEASAAERAAIAEETGLVEVGVLAARLRIERRAGGRFAVEGVVEAAITQTCVVTLEPFDSRIERPIDLLFAPQPGAIEAPRLPQRSRRREAHSDDAPPRPVVVAGNDDQEDPPDPIVDGKIDCGAVALEFLTLSLDLYPRKPGVHFADVTIGDTADGRESPFAALQRLKDGS